MLSLLQQPKSDGYPTDFLFARLRGRRQHVNAEVDRAGEWTDLLREYRWVFGAMNQRLRRMFAPCFLYFELRNLQMMLRAISGRDQGELTRLSRQSLLPQALQRQLQRCSDVEEALPLLDAWLAPEVAGWQPLAESFGSGSTRAVEQQLTDALLREFSTRSLETAVAIFVADLIDLRNLLTAARYLRWELAGPPLLAGGTEISLQLASGLAGQGMEGLQQVLRRHAVDAGADVALLESDLLKQLSRKIELAGRDPLGPDLVLDYLWRCYQSSRSTGLKFWAGEELAAWEQLA